jgi:hypothetical protein
MTFIDVRTAVKEKKSKKDLAQYLKKNLRHPLQPLPALTQVSRRKIKPQRGSLRSRMMPLPIQN